MNVIPFHICICIYKYCQLLLIGRRKIGRFLKSHFIYKRSYPMLNMSQLFNKLKLSNFFQVSDAANIIGLTHAENIQVQAEAYDVALDMSFPKGNICSS